MTYHSCAYTEHIRCAVNNSTKCPGCPLFINSLKIKDERIRCKYVDYLSCEITQRTECDKCFVYHHCIHIAQAMHWDTMRQNGKDRQDDK